MMPQAIGFGLGTLLSVANLLIPLAILTFAVGFFPYKPFLPGLAQYDETGDHEAPPVAPFDKVVFMVVDALRSDFVYSNDSGFQFTQRLINARAALPFTAHATSPTITMPRVKAITTGSIPSFLDVILNFAESDTTSTLAHQDTWLAQLKAKEGGKLVMYGDDTWLKLFPETFARADGTSSFFVSDFTEVDNNVTRHVPGELRNADWNAMIMHYLGLDHIGHKSGPRSPHMIPKQREMDSIVQKIYEAIETQPHLQSTLLILCGDHGMNDAGNHGGSAPGETSPALVFVSPKLKDIGTGVSCPVDIAQDFRYYGFVEQSDIAPTLAGLLGFPVPLNNLGVFIPDFLEFWSGPDQLQLLRRNAEQILQIVKATFPNAPFGERSHIKDCSTSASDIQELVCKWQQASQLQVERNKNSPELTRKMMQSLTEFSRRAQEIMSSAASNYDVSRLQWGICLAAASAVAACAALVFVTRDSIVAWIIFITICLSYGGMMFASSYVEEEQHFWYWTASGWLAFLIVKESRWLPGQTGGAGILTIGVLFGLRITRRWNQTGQKLAGEPDIAKTFFPVNNHIMWIVVIATYLDVLQRLARRGFLYASRPVALVISITLCLAAFGFKASFTNADAPELLRGLPQPLLDSVGNASLVVQARTVFLSIVAALAYAITSRLWQAPRKGKVLKDGSIWVGHDLLTLFLITQTRVTNIPLFLLFEIQLNLFGSLNLSLTEISVTSLLFQYLSFFALGGSNAISSVDLSNAYNGVAGYNVVAVGILTFVSNWAGPIWWTSATNLLLLQRYREGRSDALVHHLVLQTVFVTTSLVFVMVACSMLRTHLFIWTVFSPKYLFSMAWSLAQHILINVVCGSLLFWAGSV